MKKGMKLFFINVALFIAFYFLLRLLSLTLFASIFNAIFGPGNGLVASNILMRICLPIVNCLAICIPHARNEEARREFLKTLDADKYDRKADFKTLAKTKDFRIECIVFVIIYLVLFFIATQPKWIFLVAILAFPFINLWHHTAVHKQWAGERLHLAPKNQGEDEDDE